MKSSHVINAYVSPPLPQKILVVTRFGNFPDNNVCLWHTETDSLQSWILYRARLHIQNIYVILHIIYNQIHVKIHPNMYLLLIAQFYCMTSLQKFRSLIATACNSITQLIAWNLMICFRDFYQNRFVCANSEYWVLASKFMLQLQVSL